MARLIRRQLDASGYAALNAYNGEAGLKLARLEKPALILLDIGLPGMNGTTLCGIIKSRPDTSGIKVIMLTGERLMGKVEDSFSAGADGYLNKPYDLRQLLDRIARLIEA